MAAALLAIGPIAAASADDGSSGSSSSSSSASDASGGSASVESSSHTSSATSGGDRPSVDNESATADESVTDGDANESSTNIGDESSPSATEETSSDDASSSSDVSDTKVDETTSVSPDVPAQPSLVKTGLPFIPVSSLPERPTDRSSFGDADGIKASRGVAASSDKSVTVGDRSSAEPDRPGQQPVVSSPVASAAIDGAPFATTTAVARVNSAAGFLPAARTDGSLLPDLFYRLTRRTSDEGLILLNQGTAAAAVLNRRNRADGHDLMALIKPGQSLFIPKSTVAELSLGKHVWDHEATGLSLDNVTIASFLSRAVTSTSEPATRTALVPEAAATDVQTQDEVYEWLPQLPGHVDLPAPGEPGYVTDPRGEQTDTDNVIRTDENYIGAELDQTTWDAVASDDPLDRYFTLDDVPIGGILENFAWISAIEDVAFLGYRSGDIERKSGYADGFYDPDYNDAGGKIYYTNSTGKPVLVTIYHNRSGGPSGTAVETYEHVTLNPGATVEIGKPSPLTYKVITVQSPKDEDGRVNVITTQVVGYPELTNDIRVIDLPGATPSGTDLDDLIVSYATGHVDNYYFYPGSEPAAWDFSEAAPPEEPPINPTDPTVSYKITEIEDILLKVLDSQQYAFLSNTAGLIGTLLGNNVFLDGSLASSVTKISAQLTLGEYRQAAFEFASLVVDTAGEIAKTPAKVNAYLTLTVAALQVVLYAGEQAAEIDWNSAPETTAYLRQLGFWGATGVIFEEAGRAVLTVGNELGLKLADTFLQARGPQ